LLVALPAAAATSAVSCKSVETHEVRLDFAFRDGGAARGFSCPQKSAVRAVSEARQLSLVVDLVSVPGETRCRYIDLLDRCASSGCEVVRKARKCVPLDVNFDVTSGDSAVQEFTRALQALRGTLVTKDVPSEAVVVRAVAMAASCDAIVANLELAPELVGGCATSCPQILENADVSLVLDLDNFDRQSCERDVLVCATGRGPQ
jgi:hypothetical protein